MNQKSAILAVCLLVVVGFSVGRLIRRLPLPIVDIRFASEVPFNVAQPNGELPPGEEVEELVMVFVGASRCGFCTSPEMAPLVRRAAASLRERAANEGATLVSVGVAVDWVPGEGWRFLERILNFDEVVIGRQWLNSEVVELVWGLRPADPVTPQIIVYRQKTVPPSKFVRASISRGRPIKRVAGLGGIRGWVDTGCPLEVN